MKTIVLDGVEYTKAAAAAKQQGYTSDYVGQLCRAKKIDARLVGRTWFVSAESLAEYKQNTHAKTADAAPEPETRSADTASKVKINRVVVNAPLKNKTAKSTRIDSRTGREEATSDKAIFYPPLISYGHDDEDLLPQVRRNSEPTSVPKRLLNVEPASAKKLKIKTSKTKKTTFKTTEMPDVALSGKLNITDYDNGDVPAQTTAAEAELPEQAEKPKDTDRRPEIAVDTKKQKKPRQRTKPSESTADINLKTAPAPAAAPALWLRIAPLLATLLAVIVSVLLLTVVSEVQITDVLSSSGLSIELEKLRELFSL